MSKRLNDILTNVDTSNVSGDLGIKINKIAVDSRKVSKDDVFVAIKGTVADGHSYIRQAIDRGAIAIVYSDECVGCKDVVSVRVDDTSEVLPMMAANYYDNPSTKFTLVGVTGTNGKTTVATSLFNLFSAAGYRCGLISTIENIVVDKKQPAKLTTPGVLELNELFIRMVDNACQYVFMEVSSHAIAQKRIAGLDFDAAVFTNITHDHLDYHKTFKNYLDTKKSFFDSLKPSAFALSNIDDRNGKYILQNTKAKKFTYALKTQADFKAKIIEKHFDSTLAEFNGREIWLQFVGTFNVYNLLAVFGVASLFLNDEDQSLALVSSLKPVKGRFEIVKGKGVVAIIDYAHTPDAVEKVLKEIVDIKQSGTRVITIIGAGGNRDKTKRPVMAAKASSYSDLTILTSDNPRSEKPEAILDDMEEGIDKTKQFLKIIDRAEAIKIAVMLANKGDIILVAGKGHENYQEINGVRHHFDDKEIIEKLLND